MPTRHRTKNIILLNGPPRCGKTTVAEYLQGAHYYNYVNFSDVIRTVQRTLFPMTEYESFKTQQLGDGGTGRDFMIEFAESFIKPRLGPGFFAHATMDSIIAHSIARGLSDTVIGDLGFDIEYTVVCDRLIELAEALETPIQLQLWHVHRPDTDFESDSRSWVSKPDVIVHNDGDTAQLHAQINQIIRNNRKLL